VLSLLDLVTVDRANNGCGLYLTLYSVSTIRFFIAARKCRTDVHFRELRNQESLTNAAKFARA
jgi:hypothetical protein